jgi:hypothetical protein
MGRQTLIRSLHDVGLAAWFGGSLFGAVGLNGASKVVSDPSERTKVAAAGWARWAPVNGAAIAAHTVGAVGLLVANSGRVATQSGAGANTLVKTVLTGAALAVTAYSGLQGTKVAKEVPAASGVDPDARTPQDVAAAQKRLKVLQWSIPVLTGTLLVLTSQQGEQQKPSQVLKGIIPGLR